MRWYRLVPRISLGTIPIIKNVSNSGIKFCKPNIPAHGSFPKPSEALSRVWFRIFDTLNSMVPSISFYICWLRRYNR